MTKPISSQSPAAEPPILTRLAKDRRFLAGFSLWVSLYFWIGAYQAHRAENEEHFIAHHGITVAASVGSVDYQPKANQGNGLTTLSVTFRTPDGQVHRSTVGHRGIGDERLGSITQVIYDPRQPSHVVDATDIDAARQVDRRRSAVTLGSVFTVLSAGIAMSWLWKLRRKRHSTDAPVTPVATSDLPVRKVAIRRSRR